MNKKADLTERYLDCRREWHDAHYTRLKTEDRITALHKEMETLHLQLCERDFGISMGTIVVSTREDTAGRRFKIKSISTALGTP